MKQWMQSAMFEFLKRLVSRCHGNQKHATWLLGDNARPYRHALITSWIEQKDIQRWLWLAYFPDLDPCEYGASYAPATISEGSERANPLSTYFEKL